MIAVFAGRFDASVPFAAPDDRAGLGGCYQQHGRAAGNAGSWDVDGGYGFEKAAELSPSLVDHAAELSGDPTDRVACIKIQRLGRIRSGRGKDPFDLSVGDLYTIGIDTDADGASIWKRCRLCKCDQCCNNAHVYCNDAVDSGLVSVVTEIADSFAMMALWLCLFAAG